MLTVEKLKNMLNTSGEILLANTQELCQLDSVIGDGDHGLTIKKLADVLLKKMQILPETVTIKSILADIGDTFMGTDGGSVAPLWGTFFEGMSEGVENKSTLSIAEVKEMFLAGQEGLSLLSKAKIGDKTMVDALYPALNIMKESNTTDLAVLLEEMSSAAQQGSEKTIEYVAKFGRAKNIGERSLGSIDPGSKSMALLLQGFAEGFKK